MRAARLSCLWHYSLKKDVTGAVEGNKCKALQRKPHLLGEKVGSVESEREMQRDQIGQDIAGSYSTAYSHLFQPLLSLSVTRMSL